MSFIYFHAYHPLVWEAKVKAGLIDQNSGIRFCESIDIEEKYKFNHLAAVDGELYRLVSKDKLPFYIDRLQGGCFFENYSYDMALVQQYKNLLQENFYGFQMHEWMSNVISDFNKLIHGNCPEPWTEENIIATIKKEFPYENVFTEAMSAKEYAQMGLITDIQTYLTEMEKLFCKRQSYTGGAVLPCDSAYLAFPLELKAGVKTLMPEIGQQTPNASVQICFARGMTRYYNKPFGAYYEPWGGVPFSACNYHKQTLNEWNINAESFPFHTAGGNGGSSRSLQKRLQVYAYVSGASFISEEWGLCNTFYDWQDFELTPYGKVKLDFIEFTRKYPDIGKPLTPIAAVIPKDMPVLDYIDSMGTDYCSFATQETFGKQLQKVRRALRLLFGGDKGNGNEQGCLVNRYLPDAIDIVTEDCYNADYYRYAVNLTGNPLFERQYKCCSAEEVDGILSQCLPARVTGGLHHIINKTDSGKYYLTVMNHAGICRSVENGEYGLKDAEKTVQVTLKDNRRLTLSEGDAKITEDDGVYYITVPAGGFFFGSF